MPSLQDHAATTEPQTTIIQGYVTTVAVSAEPARTTATATESCNMANSNRSKVGVSMSWHLDTSIIRTVAASYMAAPIEEVNDAITFEQSAFSEIHEFKTFKVSC